MRTPESLAVRAFRALAAPGRYRVRRDAEGWPLIPGRLGAIEYHDGGRLAVWCDRPRQFAKLRAVPGVRPWQTGDREIRVLAWPEALDSVAGIIRARHRRSATCAAHLQSVPTPPMASANRPAVAV